MTTRPCSVPWHTETSGRGHSHQDLCPINVGMLGYRCGMFTPAGFREAWQKPRLRSEKGKRQRHEGVFWTGHSTGQAPGLGREGEKGVARAGVCSLHFHPVLLLTQEPPRALLGSSFTGTGSGHGRAGG